MSEGGRIKEFTLWLVCVCVNTDTILTVNWQTPSKGHHLDYYNNAINLPVCCISGNVYKTKRLHCKSMRD